MANFWEEDEIVEEEDWGKDDDILTSPLEKEVKGRHGDLEKMAKVGKRNSGLATVGGGIWNAAKSTLQTKAAVSEGINSALTPEKDDSFLTGAAKTLGRGIHGAFDPIGALTPQGTSKAIEENVPEVEFDNGAQELYAEGAGIGFGAAGGAKAVSKILPEVSTKAGKIGNYVSKFGAEVLGGTAAADDDTQAFLQMLGTDADGNYNDNLLRHKLDLAAEATLLGGVIGGVGLGVSKAVPYFKETILKAVGKEATLEAHQQAFVKDLLETFADITPDMPRQEVNKRMVAAIQKVKDNKDVVVSFGDVDVEDVKHVQDTVSAMLDNLNPQNPDHAELYETLTQLRSSSLGGGSPALNSKLKMAEREMDRSLQDFERTRGGEQSIQGAKDSVVEGAQRQLEPVRQQITDTRGELVRAKRGVDAEMAENPAFQDIVDRNPGSDVKIDYTSGETNRAQDILEHTNRADELFTRQKNEKFADIPEDELVNEVALADTLEDAAPWMDDRMRAEIGDAGGSFKKLSNWATTTLDARIKTKAAAAKSTEDWAEVSALKRLKKNLSEDQENLIGEDASDIAQEAKRYYKDEYAPKFRDSPLEDIQETNRFKPPKKALVENRATIESTLSDPKKREFSDTIIDTLQSEEGGKSGKLAGDYVMYKIAKSTRNALNKTGKLSPEDALALTDEFDRYIPVLEKTNPGKVKEIEGFLTSLRDKNFNVKEVEAKLKTFEDLGRDAEENLLGGKLKEFFSKEGGVYTAKDNGFKIFNDMMEDPQAGPKIDSLLAQADNDPVIKKGMQAAWAKGARDRILSNDAGLGKASENFIKAGKKVYGDQIVDGIMELDRLARAGERANKARGAGGLDINRSGSERTLAVNNVITWVWGVLNPTAARIRTVTGDLLKRYNPKDRAHKAADMIMSDPELFTKIADDMMAQRRNMMDPAEKKTLFRAMVQAGIALPRDEKELTDNTVDDQTQEVLNR